MKATEEQRATPASCATSMFRPAHRHIKSTRSDVQHHRRMARLQECARHYP
jgi:hypothetical protein